MKKLLSLIIILTVIIVAGITAITYISPDIPKTLKVDISEPAPKGEIAINTPRSTIIADVVSLPLDIEKGLGGKISLPANEGMLFVFSKPIEPAFWMKNMFFPIDIIWIDSTRTVVGITKKISPSTFPETFYPPSPVKYVLEVNAGQAEANNIVEGTILGF